MNNAKGNYSKNGIYLLLKNKVSDLIIVLPTKLVAEQFFVCVH